MGVTVSRRMTGPALFRQQLLAQEGALVHIPATLVLPGNAKQLTAYLRDRLKAEQGGSAAVQA